MSTCAAADEVVRLVKVGSGETFVAIEQGELDRLLELDRLTHKIAAQAGAGEFRWLAPVADLQAMRGWVCVGCGAKSEHRLRPVEHAGDCPCQAIDAALGIGGDDVDP